jgi:hypothetical protein
MPPQAHTGEGQTALNPLNQLESRVIDLTASAPAVPPPVAEVEAAIEAGRRFGTGRETNLEGRNRRQAIALTAKYLVESRARSSL